MKILLISCSLFNKILFFILNIILLCLFYVKFLLITENDYNKYFYNNKERALLMDIEKNNCKRPFEFLFIYEKELSDSLKTKIIEKCKYTVYYNTYLFNKSLFLKDIEQSLDIYQKIVRSNNSEEINNSMNMIKLIYPYLTLKDKEMIGKKIK